MRAVLCIALFARIIGAQNSDPEKLFQEAVAAQQRGDFTLAVRDYQKLIEIRPDSVEVLANLGAALVHLNRFDEAIANYRSALKLDPENPAIRLNLGLAFYKKGDFRSAVEQFEMLRKAHPDNPRIVTLIGDCYTRVGEIEKAVAILEPVQRTHPDDLDLTYVLGSAMVRVGRRRDGVGLLERVAKAGKSADAYMLAGSTLLDLNEFEQARQDLDMARQLNPNLPGIHTLCGIARDKLGDPNGAEPEFRKGLETNPNDFQANLYLGAILYKRRDLQSARHYVERSLELNASSSMAHYEIALVKSASGEFDAAIQDLEKVVTEDPNWLEPHVQLAALYYKTHREAEGLKQREIVDRLRAAEQKRGPTQTPPL